ncbi:MAG TPA: hypothetical protein VN806_10580 [Caulobacteraceae bacterium]|nr:hypothetical protein [Caulobacteraceae bacterium]
MRDSRAFKGTLVGVSALAALMLPAGGAIAVVNKTTTRSSTQHNVRFNPALGHGVGKRRHGRSLVIEKDLDSTSSPLFRAAATGVTHHHKITIHANTGIK